MDSLENHKPFIDQCLCAMRTLDPTLDDRVQGYVIHHLTDTFALLLKDGVRPPLVAPVDGLNVSMIYARDRSALKSGYLYYARPLK